MTRITTPPFPDYSPMPPSRRSPVRGQLRQVKPRGPVLRFQYNPASVIRTGGVGGWQEIARPDRKSVLEWAGRSLQRLTFTLVFDGWPHRSVERDIRTLTNMGEPRAPRRPPPELEFDFGPVGRQNRWVIESLEYGTELRDTALNRVRQDVTVTLVEYVETDVTLTPVAKHKNKGNDNDDDGKGGKGGKSAKRTYVVKRGDTLSSIAAKLLGDHKRWRDIARLNDIRDPNRIKVGQRLKIPGD